MTKRLDWFNVLGACLAFAVWLLATDRGEAILKSWVGSDPSERPGEIVGVVRGAEGAELPPGLRVIVHPVRRFHPGETDSLEFVSGQLGARDALVEADGRYSLKLPKSGDYSLSVVGPEHRPSWQQVRVAERTSVETLLEFEGYALSGTLMGPQEEVLSGTEVYVLSHAGHLIDRQRTDERGAFRLVLPGGEYLFGFEHPEYSSPLQRRLVLADEQSTFYMTPSRPLTVRVEGDSFQRARVAVYDAQGRLAANGMTDGRGAFHISHLPPGNYQVWAGGHADSGMKPLAFEGSSAAQQLSVTTSHEEASAEVQLYEGCQPQAVAFAPATGGRTLRRALTPAEMRVTEQRKLQIWLPPFAAHVAVNCGDDQIRLWLPEGSGEPSISSWRGITEATGRVLDDAGTPLADAHVIMAIPPLAAGDVPWVQTNVTDGQGQFRLELPMGTEGELRVTHPRFGVLSRSFSQGEELSELEFRFAPAHFLEGKVVDDQGQPVAESTVAFTSLTSGNLSVQTQDDGKFRLGPLGEQQGYLVVFEGGQPLQKEPLVVSPESGKEISVTIAPRSL